MKTTYFVSGFMRCGTSMMMDALTAGGLDPAFNADRNQMNSQYGDQHYQPNPNGFYELNRQEYAQLGFPRMYEGKLIKLLFPGMSKIVAGKYKVVFMRRDYEEIRQSHEAFFNKPLPVKEDVLSQRIADAIGILEQRRDVSIKEVWYRDVVENPLEVFNNLKDQEAWPIDAGKAALVVDPELCRFKNEELDKAI